MPVIILLIFLAQVGWGANVTQAQVDQAKRSSIEIIQCGQELLKYANAIGFIISQNFQIPIIGSTETITLPQAQKDRVIDTSVYQAKKQACVDAFNELP